MTGLGNKCEMVKDKVPEPQSETNIYAEAAAQYGIEGEPAKKDDTMPAYGTIKVTAHEQVRAFHEKFGLSYEGPPRHLPSHFALFRTLFLLEEVGEYAEASGFVELAGQIEKVIADNKLGSLRNAGDMNLEKQLDALVDLSYILHGNAYLQGFKIDEAFRVVHAANMKKVRAEKVEDSKRGSTYDVVKPPGWTPPDLSEFVR